MMHRTESRRQRPVAQVVSQQHSVVCRCSFVVAAIALVLNAGIARAQSAVRAPTFMPPSPDWTLIVEELGHEGDRRLELKRDGQYKVLGGRPTVGRPAKVESTGAVPEVAAGEAYAAAEKLIRQFPLTDRARPDVWRDDDLAYQIAIKTSNRSITVRFQSAEQRRDKLLTAHLNRLLELLNPHLPAGKRFLLGDLSRDAK